MQVGDILTLDYDEKYLLINKVEYEGKNYHLAIGVTPDESDIDLDDITFFEEIKEKEETYVKEVFNEELLDKLAESSLFKTMKETKEIEKLLEEYYSNNENN